VSLIVQNNQTAKTKLVLDLAKEPLLVFVHRVKIAAILRDAQVQKVALIAKQQKQQQ
jgi:hypothetical protein